MRDPRDVQLLIYLVWIAIPVSLFVLGCLHRVMLLFVAGNDARARLRPKRLLRLANLLFLTAVTALIFDYFLIQSGRLVPPYSKSAQYYRLGAFPIAAVMFLCLAEMIRFGQPRQKYEKMKVEVRGSNPLFTILAILVFAFLVGKSRSSEEASYVSVPRSSPSETASSASASAEKRSTPPSQTGVLASIGRWFDSVAILFSGGSSEHAKVEGSFAEVFVPPDFNQEAYLRLKSLVIRTSEEEGVDSLLILSMVQVSSGFQENLSAESGAGGLLMLSPDTLRIYGLKNIFDPEQNVRAGARHLKKLLALYENDLHRALFAFRAGTSMLEPHAQLPQAGDGAAFVERVMSVYEIARVRGSLE